MSKVSHGPELICGLGRQDEWWVHGFPITDPTGSVEYGVAFSEVMARRFAAAPELLAFAEHWVAAWDNAEDGNMADFEIGMMLADLAGEARAAIAKATRPDPAER